MLVASNHYRDLDEPPPRIISEVRKSWLDIAPWHNFKPRLSGDLLVKYDNDSQWWPRKVSIRNGFLYTHKNDIHGSVPWRLPLRFLSLIPGSLPNSLHLCKDKKTIVSIQVPDEEFYDLWVKTIAIELIRQTPLEAIKYLDIFTLINCWQAKPPNRKDHNFNQIIESTTADSSIDEIDCATCYTHDLPKLPPPSPPISDKRTDQLEQLIKKCQNSEMYVPVKEKLLLFESLSKLGRKTKSSEDVSCKNCTEIVTKRTQSMHDLTYLTPKNCVKDICKYFEIQQNNQWKKQCTIIKTNNNNNNNNNNNHVNNNNKIRLKRNL